MGTEWMEALEERCCRLDVHKKVVVVRVITPEGKEIKTLGTMTGDLLKPADWLMFEGGTHSAMESTRVCMNQFPSGVYLASRAGLCPGNDGSSGKQKNGPTRHGNPHLRQALVEAAETAAHTKDAHVSGRYHRVAARRGAEWAAAAVAYRVLGIICHMLRKGGSYQDPGPNFREDLNRSATVHRAVKRLKAVEYRVALEDAT